MPTDRLYYDDCYLVSFDACVTGLSPDKKGVYLDRTAFYPSSGGQPNDLGMLGGQMVVDVIDEEEHIAHVLDAPLTVEPGANLRGQVNWERRYDHMQQHTGQHLLSAVLVDLFRYQTLSFHLGSAVATIELGIKELTDAQTDQAEERANAITREARPVRISFEEAEAAQGLRKASQRAGKLRIVEIQGVDRSACGGTHVRSTAEIAPIQIRRSEKIRGNTRIEFVCGARAVARAKQDFRIALDLAKQSATAIDKLPQHVATIRQRLADAEKERQRLTADLAKRDGNELYLATATAADGLRRAWIDAERIEDTTRVMAQAFASQAKAVILVTARQPLGVLVACSTDAGVDAGAVLKKVLATAGGRGGGTATLAQGSFPDARLVTMLRAELGFEK